MEVQWGLSLASVFAVVLAFIIIVNTFLMNVSERGRSSPSCGPWEPPAGRFCG